MPVLPEKVHQCRLGTSAATLHYRRLHSRGFLERPLISVKFVSVFWAVVDRYEGAADSILLTEKFRSLDVKRDQN